MGSLGQARGAPNLLLRRIRESERGESREQFAEAMAAVARDMGYNVIPDAKYVESLESGRVAFPGPAYRSILSRLCGRPVAELGFRMPPVSVNAREANSRLRDAMFANGIETRALARKVGVDPKSVERWMTRGVIPRAGHRHLASKILNCPESELWPETTRVYSADSASRELEVPSENASILDSGCLPRRRVTAADIEVIEDFTQTFRRLDNKFGGGHAHGLAAHYLNSNVLPILREGSCTDEVGRRLFGAAAQLAHLIGWTAYDTENHGSAELYFRNALEFSAAVGDVAFGGEILAAKSHHAIHLHRPKEALQLARASANAANAAAIPALRAEACALEANAYAVLGDKRACVSSLDRAEIAFDLIRTEDTPDWLHYLDECYLAARFAHCFRDLEDWSHAREFASRAAGLNATLTRSHAFNTIVLATTYIETDVDYACHIGSQVLNVAASLQSSRIVNYIGAFSRRLAERHKTNPIVGEFIEQANEMLGVL